ncbi:CaiB/BaiF CoA-transferase family protein [Paraburkholderia sediminicola]|uniref:CaiB/BaiF CoA transferase family protein n=1 Tax=Paraburkholderia sediminicola TaxID=458836 RepID=UPI0038BDC358
MSQPLSGVKVVDFSTLLPGPLCTLLLAEAGAEVLKIEKPGSGDDMRGYEPKVGPDSVNFGLLNRGKRSVALDLKSAQGRDAAFALAAEADVLVEQFRPGVMERLGLGYDVIQRANPRLVYCSITGYGQSGPKAQTAAHDLNYLAQSGMLSLSTGADGAPVLPPALIADIAGGAYPAMMNILLALRQRDATGHGSLLDISMADNLFPFMYWGLGSGWSGNGWPRPGAELVTGGTARYRIYRTQDGKYLAAAPLEDKFWRNFAEVLGDPELAQCDDRATETVQRVSSLIAARTAAEWVERFARVDACTVEVVSLEQASADPHFVQRGLFDRSVRLAGGTEIAALPVPIASEFRASTPCADAPPLA